MTLHITDLQHTYKRPNIPARTVLDIPSWKVPRDEHILLRGISGSGKTTLLNIIAGLLHPTSGTVTLHQQSLYALSEAVRDRFRMKHIGYIFQSHYLLPSLTSIENVVMPMAFARRENIRKQRDFAFQLLESVSLGEFAHHRPAQLSAGQRMRVSVARALANQPDLILADEPTAALDSESAEDVMNLLQDYCNQHHATLIVASHDPALSQRFEQEIHLEAGRIFSMSGVVL